MNDSIFRWLLGGAYLIVIVIVSVYRRRAQAGEQYNHIEEEGAEIAIPLRVAGLVMWLTPPATALFPRLMAWSTISLPDWAQWVAAVVALLILPPYTIWAQRSLGRNVSTTVITKENHELVTNGPYRYIRHPLYTGGMIGFTAFAVLGESWLIFAALLAGYIPLMIRLKEEEARLIERFGDEYRAYQKRTGALLPRLSRNPLAD